MSIFSGLKNFLGKINELDGSILSYGKDFADVYEKNIALEEEIAQRTKELEKANQTLVTLNSVWDMMNSSKPLSSMLETVVNTLHDNMGYEYAAIIELSKDDNNSFYLSLRATSMHPLLNKLMAYMPDGIESFKAPYLENSIIARAINERRTLSTPDIKGVIKMLFPDISDEKFVETTQKINARSCTIVPLQNQQQNFGCLFVTSERNGITDTEENFLTLYANQIGLGITVADLFEKVKKQAITDPLTTLYNRRYFEDNIIKEAERSLRLRQPFSIISLDLDYLKKINDTYGHQYGDIAIKTIANVIKKEARSIDIPARIGGEEFNLLLPGVDSVGAQIAAERIRKSIESQVIETIGGVTASIGVATFLEHSDRIDELIELADQAMYKAKINGRNRVVVAESEHSTDWQKVAIETFMDILSKRRIPVEESVAKTIYQKLEKIKAEDQNTKEALFSIVDTISKKYNQTYKPGTTKAKQILAVLLAKKLDLAKDEIDKLKLAVLLYDIGNIMIPEEILNKKEPLTDEERNIIKTHPVIAAREILQPISEIQDIIPIIENHHENWNGKGYPQQKSGIEIPITSQIILLVDAFYAMTQDRPYRKAYSSDEVLNIIKSEAGERWNEKLVEDFILVVKDEQL